MYLTNLAAVLRGAGVPVIEVGGWTGRGHGGMLSTRSIVVHHTAGAANGDYPSLNVVTGGRSDLSGPLANLGLGRSGTWYVIAAGLAYHAGDVYDSTYANKNAIGIEAENTGTGQTWPEAQLRSMERGIAALCKAYGIPVDRVKGHKEICKPVGRKIDPAGIPGDMAGVRGRVSGAQAAPSAPAPSNNLLLLEESVKELKPGKNMKATIPVAGRFPNLWISNGFGATVEVHQITPKRRTGDVRGPYGVKGWQEKPGQPWVWHADYSGPYYLGDDGIADVTIRYSTDDPDWIAWVG